VCVVATGCYCFVVANKKPDPPKRERYIWIDGEPYSAEEVYQGAGFKERDDPQRDLEKRKEKDKRKRKSGSALGRIKAGVPKASKGDSLRGLTSEGGTSSLLKGMLRYMSGK
jgi:hypothetical protein